MATEIIMPKMNAAMVEGKLVKWLKNDGEKIGKGDAVALVMSKKVTFEVKAAAGGILNTVARPGQVVPVGRPIGYILENESDNVPLQADSGPAEMVGGGKPSGSGRTSGSVQVMATPIARRLARENGIDLSVVEGTGSGGLINGEDILRVVEQAKSMSERSVTKRIPFTGLRREIADNMMDSLQSMAQVTASSEADATGLVEFRRRLKEVFNLTYTDILVKIVALALRSHPLLNATVAEDEIVIPDDVNVGVAVAVEDGLIVPVVHRADTLSLKEIAAATSRLIESARQGALSMDDVTGGTFTITNVGMFGLDGFTPIINPPQVAILGVGRIVERPVVVGGQVEIRPTMNLGLTFDHRVMDGAPAAQFLQSIKKLIENPYGLFDFKENIPSVQPPVVGGHKDPRQIYDKFSKGMDGLLETSPDLVMGFSALAERVFFEDGEISLLNKELIAVALSVYMKCEYCITAHVYKALQAGATPEQILEAAGVAVFFGGGAAMAYTAALVQDCIKTFAK
ncbi:MAG: 2-oxo acid dehydrogenase subunit E2 [Bacillota bacterium]